MKKTLFLITILLTMNIKSSSNDSKSEDDIIKESQICGEHRFNLESCYETNNCVYMEWFVDELNTEISFCFSYNEIMKYFVVDPKEYLEKHGIRNHTNINKSNFCDIMDENSSFLGIDGSILLCKVEMTE